MKKSVILAFIIFLSILAYFMVRSAMGDDTANVEAISASGSTIIQSQEQKNQELPRVVTRELHSQLHPVYLTLKGRTAPNRTVTVSSGTTGSVIEAPNLEGKIVRSGALLCRLEIDARQARVLEAEALVEAQQQEFNAASRLVEKNLAPTNRLNTAKANLDAATATLNAAKIELKRTEIRAPFSGVFETRIAERGDFLSPGSGCGVIADLDPILIEAEVTEEYVTALNRGAPADISILGAAQQGGEISYVARTSNETTRTFKIEVSLPNKDAAISAGLTTDVKIQLANAQATLMSPGLLTLHDDGRLGVRHVTSDGVVKFATIKVIDDTPEGIWVTGLPERATVVSLGQEYIGEGARVTVVPETSAVR